VTTGRPYPQRLSLVLIIIYATCYTAQTYLFACIWLSVLQHNERRNAALQPRPSHGGCRCRSCPLWVPYVALLAPALFSGVVVVFNASPLVRGGAAFLNIMVTIAFFLIGATRVVGCRVLSHVTWLACCSCCEKRETPPPPAPQPPAIGESSAAFGDGGVWSTQFNMASMSQLPAHLMLLEATRVARGDPHRLAHLLLQRVHPEEVGGEETGGRGEEITPPVVKVDEAPTGDRVSQAVLELLHVAVAMVLLLTVAMLYTVLLGLSYTPGRHPMWKTLNVVEFLPETCFVCSNLYCLRYVAPVIRRYLTLCFGQWTSHEHEMRVKRFMAQRSRQRGRPPAPGGGGSR
jgi:hypothetical protein